MRFLIYGAGALGQALGCLLAVNGHTVDLILRKRFKSVLQENGLRVSGIFGDYSTNFLTQNLVENITEVAHRHYDYLLLTTKAYDTKVAIQEIGKLKEQVRYIVSMQNGCGNVEMLEEYFGQEKTLGSRVITGFEISSPGHVKITVSADAIHVGGCIRGQIPQSAIDLASAITAAGHDCLAVKDIYQSLFSKLLYNCTLNPLGAILGVHYGLLAEQDETKQLMGKIIEETYAVIHGLGGTTAWADSTSYKDVFFKTLIPATYNHRPSMLQDLENGKPTEIDALTGYVSEQGRHLGLSTPTCDMLTSLVKFKEKFGLGEQ